MRTIELNLSLIEFFVFYFLLFQGLKIRKQRSTGDLEKRGNGSGSIRSTASTASWLSTESSQSGMTNKYKR